MTLEDALADYGLVINSPLIIDGLLHRCGTKSKPRGKNGWYIVYDNGRATCFGNWESGDSYEFWSDGTTTESYDSGRIETLRAERQAEYDKKAVEAQEYIESLPSDGFSEYLKRKKIYPHGAKFDGSALIIPVTSSGTITSYQRIYADGSKYFMSGGLVSGCYYIIASRNISKDELVVVCEGFATGAAIHQATDLPVVCAFNAGNLKKVCDNIPFTNLLIAADNDESGVGEKYAEQTGYPYILPPFVGWDFSDMYVNGKCLREMFGVDAIEVDSNCENIKVHGLVGEIADWITSTAIKPQPMLSLAAALSFVGMLRGHKIRGYTDLRTNLLVMSLAPTASGKEHPQNAIKRLATACALDAHLMGEPVSGGGFLTGLNKAGRVGLLVMDEVGRYIGNLSSRNAGTHQREIIDYIIKTFSCANSVLKGRQYVDDKKNPTIDIIQPHFCCIGSTVAERLQESCGSSEVVDGFLNRWVVFNVKKRVKRNKKVKFSPPPESLVKKIQEIGRAVYDPYGEPEIREVRFTPEAWDYFENYREKIDDIVDAAPYPKDKLYSRTCEHVEKIALTLSDGEDVLIKDVRCAIQIVEQSNKSILEFANMIADNVLEGDYIRVREIVRGAGEITKAKLARKTQFVTGGGRRLQEIVKTLVDGLIIAERTVKTGGRPAVSYKWIGDAD